MVGVNHRSNAGIDRCGWYSLQEKNYKAEVKTPVTCPFKHPIDLSALVHRHALGDPERHGKY